VGPSGDVADVLTDLAEHFRARIADEEVLPARGAPYDLIYPDPGPLRRINAPWDPLASGPSGAVSTGDAVVVAVIDSGVMTKHPDLDGHLLPGVSVIEGDAESDVDDEDGHGTLLAGTILSAANHSPAVRLMPVKFIDGRTRPQAKRAAEALWKAMKGHPRPDVINLSWDLGVGSDELREAFDAVAGEHILVVVAAGNSGANNDVYPTFPACYGHRDCSGRAGRTLENVITVMATDRFDHKPGFSNYGAESVHLAAPGVGIVSTHLYLGGASAPGRGRLYQRYDGTSAAAAYVTGAAALLKSANRSLDAEALKDRLISAADRLPDLLCQARGRLNLGKAL
jgi:subtilisin family serine protease